MRLIHYFNLDNRLILPQWSLYGKVPQLTATVIDGSSTKVIAIAQQTHPKRKTE